MSHRRGGGGFNRAIFVVVLQFHVGIDHTLVSVACAVRNITAFNSIYTQT